MTLNTEDEVVGITLKKLLFNTQSTPCVFSRRYH